MLKKYVNSLLRKWVVWVFFFLDVIGIPLLVVTILWPNSPLPTWILWGVLAIAVLCFAVANYLVFADEQNEKRQLLAHIDRLEAIEANLELTEPSIFIVPGNPSHRPKFVKLKLNEYGYDHSGMPGWAVIWIRFALENVGHKPGQLVVNLDKDASELPPAFAFDSSLELVRDRPFSVDFEPQERYEVWYWLGVHLAEQEPVIFARALKQLAGFKLSLAYSTRRIGGESDVKRQVLHGDFDEFRQHVLEYWNGHGFGNLARLATNDTAST